MWLNKCPALRGWAIDLNCPAIQIIAAVCAIPTLSRICTVVPSCKQPRLSMKGGCQQAYELANDQLCSN